jgi:large subunit ribosomal protein L18
MPKTLKRRRIEGKTDYGKRLKLLKSRAPRIVFRKTNKYFIVQYVDSKEAQDKITIGLSSKDLTAHGWPESAKGSLKSLPAAYLIGFLMGEKIAKEKLKTPIIDFGMHRMVHKSRTYAFLKGLIDAGVKIKHKQDTFPEKDRIEGKHMKHKIPFEKIKLSMEKEK